MDKSYHHPRRLIGYDYRLPGAYFITLVAHFRQFLFGAIEQGEVHLGPIGQIAEQEWLRLPARFPWVELPAYVIMPNHIQAFCRSMNESRQPKLASRKNTLAGLLQDHWQQSFVPTKPR